VLRPAGVQFGAIRCCSASVAGLGMTNSHCSELRMIREEAEKLSPAPIAPLKIWSASFAVAKITLGCSIRRSSIGTS
jgi:hypothetical protein